MKKEKKMFDKRIVRAVKILTGWELERITRAETRRKYNTNHEGHSVLMEEIDEAGAEFSAIRACLNSLWDKVKHDEGVDSVLCEIISHATLLALESIQVAAVAKKWRKGVCDGLNDEQTEDIRRKIEDKKYMRAACVIAIGRLMGEETEPEEPSYIISEVRLDRESQDFVGKLARYFEVKPETIVNDILFALSRELLVPSGTSEDEEESER